MSRIDDRITRLRALREAMDDLANATPNTASGGEVSAGATSTGTVSGAGALDGRAIADAVEKAHQDGVRYAWMAGD